jgi:hypothetical protein
LLKPAFDIACTSAVFIHPTPILPFTRAAFGVMMWEAATGAAAFKGLHYGGFYQAVVVEGARPPLPPGLARDYAQLMTAVSGDEPVIGSPNWRSYSCKSFLHQKVRLSNFRLQVESGSVMWQLAEDVLQGCMYRGQC